MPPPGRKGRRRMSSSFARREQRSQIGQASPLSSHHRRLLLRWRCGGWKW
nr:hypothetical protein Iba_chr04bCG19260 [Ipomoea batatas]